MFYLHIPKTGGQTLARRLASAFPPGRAHLQEGQFTYPADCAALGECLSAHDFVEAHLTGQCRATIRVRMRDNQDENPVWGGRRRA